MHIVRRTLMGASAAGLAGVLASAAVITLATPPAGAVAPVLPQDATGAASLLLRSGVDASRARFFAADGVASEAQTSDPVAVEPASGAAP